MTDAGWNERVFTFYDPEGAEALRGTLERFDGGRLVVNLVDMPIKCQSRRSSSPSSPTGTCASAESATARSWSTRRRSTGPSRSRSPRTPGWPARREGDRAGDRIQRRRGRRHRRHAPPYDGRELDFDLLVTIPLHGGAPYVERSPGLGGALGFVPTDKRTLQTPVKPNVFALGDATDLPTSKAGSVTHFEAEVLTENIARYLADEELDAGYDGHANCFIETGFHKALLIDFNYETEPLPGHFPIAFGLPLLRESRLSHLGKLAFQWVYWHALLPGREIPGIGPAMPTAGKRAPVRPERRTR